MQHFEIGKKSLHFPCKERKTGTDCSFKKNRAQLSFIVRHDHLYAGILTNLDAAFEDWNKNHYIFRLRKGKTCGTDCSILKRNEDNVHLLSIIYEARYYLLIWMLHLEIGTKILRLRKGKWNGLFLLKKE